MFFSGQQSQEKIEFIKFIFNRKLHNNVILYKSTSNFIKENTNIQNITLYYQIADIFNVTILGEASLHYIGRCFTIVMETRNYKELKLKLVRKIIGSSELHITSELEVFNAADD